MRDDTAEKLAQLAFKAFIYLLFGVFILAFKYPKVGIPLLVVGGVVLWIMMSQ